MQLFEGMKAYRGVDGVLRMFRPFENMNRMRSTAQRCSLPVSKEINLMNHACQCIDSMIHKVNP